MTATNGELCLSDNGVFLFYCHNCEDSHRALPQLQYYHNCEDRHTALP